MSANLTREDVATLLGVSIGTIYQWQKKYQVAYGCRSFTPDQVKALKALQYRLYEESLARRARMRASKRPRKGAK